MGTKISIKSGKRQILENKSFLGRINVLHEIIYTFKISIKFISASKVFLIHTGIHLKDNFDVHDIVHCIKG